MAINQSFGPEWEAPDWRQSIEELRELLSRWVADLGWTVDVRLIPGTQKPVSDLTIRTPDGEIDIDIKTPWNEDGPSRIEVRSYPNLRRIRLVRKKGEASWRILTDSGVYIHKPFDQKTFLEVVEDLLAEGE
jgi:hypothetical protein